MHRQQSDCAVVFDRLIFSQLHQPIENVLSTILNLNSNSHLLDCQVPHYHLHSNIYGYCLLIFAKSRCPELPCLGHRVVYRTANQSRTLCTWCSVKMLVGEAEPEPRFYGPGTLLIHLPSEKTPLLCLILSCAPQQVCISARALQKQGKQLFQLMESSSTNHIDAIRAYLQAVLRTAGAVFKVYAAIILDASLSYSWSNIRNPVISHA